MEDKQIVVHSRITIIHWDWWSYIIDTIVIRESSVCVSESERTDLAAGNSTRTGCKHLSSSLQNTWSTVCR